DIGRRAGIREDRRERRPILGVGRPTEVVRRTGVTRAAKLPDAGRRPSVTAERASSDEVSGGVDRIELRLHRLAGPALALVDVAFGLEARRVRFERNLPERLVGAADRRRRELDRLRVEGGIVRRGAVSGPAGRAVR